jgi:glycosyltransferase involved in cell wall biosynthesis
MRLSIMPKKIPVCVLLPDHFSSHLGGAEYQAGLLTDALCKTKKYELFYVCQRANENFIPQDYQIHVVGKKRLSGSLFSFLSAMAIYDKLNKIRPAIIYQNVGGIQTGVAGYYAKKNRIRFIWHIASDDDVSPQWKSNLARSFRTLPERLFLNYGIKHATVIAAQTKYQATLLKAKFGIDCQDYIPIGHPFPEEQLVKSSPLSVLWIANLKPLKRPEVFVNLAKHFSERDDVQFIMIGRSGWGPWFDWIKMEIKNLPNFKYVGEIPQDEVNQYLNRGHILVNTSRYEGFSNTFVQAWMRRVPVVSLTVDPDQILVKEKIGFQSGIFKQLCADVDKLICDNKLRTEMGERALIYARKNHSVNKMISQAIKLFEM